MQLPLFQRLFDHMEWADALVWRTMINEKAASRDDYILDGLVHLHLVQHAYLAVWKGENVAMASRDDFAGPVEIRNWGRSFYPEAASFIGQLSEERLSQVIPIPWTEFIEREIGGPPSPASLGDLLLQVVAHSVHHRAQVNRRIREVGGTPPMVDYIGWIWRGKPAPDWSDV